MPGARTHALGYCLGGTLLAMAAAALGRVGSKALKTVSLLAAQTDFTDPGELSLFIDEGQVSFLEHQMWRQGFLDKKQMRGTFQMLRSKDLVWSYRLINHLLGERRPMTDLMAWNADGTRLPFRMHSEYLRSLFLRNALAHGEFELDGVPISLDDIRVPIFNLGTVQDHVAPWRSVFKLNRLTDADQTFVLTAGGHNAGIVNPPGQVPTSYRIAHWKRGDRLLTPDEWLAQATEVDGSWWTAWFDWLAARSSAPGRPPAMGAPSAGAAGARARKLRGIKADGADQTRGNCARAATLRTAWTHWPVISVSAFCAEPSRASGATSADGHDSVGEVSKVLLPSTWRDSLAASSCACSTSATSASIHCVIIEPKWRAMRAIWLLASSA